MIGSLSTEPALERPDLLAEPVAAALRTWSGSTLASAVEVAEIDPDLADTAAFCARYGVALDVSANCVVLAAKRGGGTSRAAAVVLATTRADVNGLARRRLEARKCSFAATNVAVEVTGMEHGGITPIGLPVDWARTCTWHARSRKYSRCHASATVSPIASTPWFSSITTQVSSPTASPIRLPSSAASA